MIDQTFCSFLSSVIWKWELSNTLTYVIRFMLHYVESLSVYDANIILNPHHTVILEALTPKGSTPHDIYTKSPWSHCLAVYEIHVMSQKKEKKHTCDQIYNEVLLELEQHIGICDSVQPQFLLIHQLVYLHGKQILLATVAAQNNGTGYPVLPWILLLSNSWKSLHSAVE